MTSGGRRVVSNTTYPDTICTRRWWVQRTRPPGDGSTMSHPELTRWRGDLQLRAGGAKAVAPPGHLAQPGSFGIDTRHRHLASVPEVKPGSSEAECSPR